MRGLLVSTALAAALYACGSEPPETGNDTEAIRDQDAAVPSVEVSNVGEACDAPLACGGAAAECLTRSSTATTYLGGYCTASCAMDAECGPLGVCPIAEAERIAPKYDFMDSWPRKCFRRCVPGDVDSCRSGYRCLSLAEAYWREGAPAPMHVPICIPAGMNGDAGMSSESGDAGSELAGDASLHTH